MCQDKYIFFNKNMYFVMFYFFLNVKTNKQPFI